jgi:hypothetical protein
MCVFFRDRTEWCSFHKFPDFSCSRCVKRVSYSAFVWKCIYMSKHRFGVQLFQNPQLCSSTASSGHRQVVAKAHPGQCPPCECGPGRHHMIDKIGSADWDKVPHGEGVQEKNEGYQWLAISNGIFGHLTHKAIRPRYWPQAGGWVNISL